MDFYIVNKVPLQLFHKTDERTDLSMHADTKINIYTYANEQIQFIPIWGGFVLQDRKTKVK